jgi:NhaP-type Na+/H+ or K+/H+ antiporter
LHCTVSTLAVFAELKVDPTLFYLVFGESVLNDAVVSSTPAQQSVAGAHVYLRAGSSSLGHCVVPFFQGACRARRKNCWG